MSTAVIGGFRVHPDPGGDGVIQVLEGQKVVINATDVASRPPATQSYLIVNWGDGPNQRVGCGPCRLEHGYAPGRYTLEATADDLQPTAQAGSSTNRSISVVVEVLGRREVEEPAPAPFVSRFAAFGFYPAVLAIGDTALAVTPHPVPPGITLLFGDIVCADTVGTPDDSIIELLPGGWIVVPNGLAIAYEAISPGTCRFTQYATNNGTPFAETSTLTIR